MKKVLIANRGEIACRIIRALHELSIKAVAVYSEADKESLHVKLADEAICIGKASVKDSYLNISRIIAACEIAGVDGVHPGYGFLSENPLFAEIVERSGLIFIGPSSDKISLLGDKMEAKKLAQKANCPVIPGSLDKVESLEEGLKITEEIGFPVVIKASSGGGGKGIRIVFNKEEFKRGYLSAKKEAKHCFDDDSIYIEKRIENPKHLEVQIAADKFGNVIHLFERDCTLQKRRQKLIEETLSDSIDDEQRKNLCNSAVSLMKEAGYDSVGTVEFLLDPKGRFYFMEVNTRVQVEHTITEELTGIDLVKLQIQSSMGKELNMSQKDVKVLGYAMEFRINAEDPKKEFCPTPGLVEEYIPPVGKDIRIESAIYQGFRISPFYDSMIAKLIVKGKSRLDVIHKSRLILREFFIKGVATTLPFFIEILEDDLFINNKHVISSIDDRISKGV